MKSVVLKEKLKEGLLIAERICAKSASLPILTNILLTAEKNKLEISATDLEVGVKYSILAKNEKEGSLVVAPKALGQFVGLIPEHQATLSAKENQLEIQSKEFRAAFKGLSSEEFPIIPSLKGGEESVEIETTPLCQGIASVVSFTGQTQARPEISGVLFLFQKKDLKLASTDSFRLAEKTLHLKKESGAEKSFILPQKAARELVSILSGRSGHTTIFFSPSQVIFDYSSEGQPQEPAIRLVSRLIEGEYPPYQDVIPAKHTTTALVDREEILNHIRAASLFSGRMSDVRLTADPAKKQIELGAKSAEIGENASCIQGAVTGEKVSAAFNWRFLGEGISQMKSKNIEMLFSGEEGPAMIRPALAEDEGFLYVVMPIKA